MDGIQPTPMKSRPQIDVTFDIDSNYELTVTARETSSGKEMTVKITNNDKEMFNVSVEDELQARIVKRHASDGSNF